MAIKLGSIVRDSITGFTGLAVCRSEWLYGCARVGIQATELKDGKPVEVQHFDEQSVEVVKPGKPKISKDSSAESGGPQSYPQRNSSSQ
jgi:hypothetical protein